jgi:glycosidase
VQPRRLADLDLAALTARPGHFTTSPVAWEDEVLYFLLLDRFSDGREADRPPLRPGDRGNAVTTEADAAAWRAAGASWVGGTLQGLRSKLGYLQRLGVTALWVSPVLKQAAFQETYHGYGTQNFLAVDPHFGTAEDLRDAVSDAHARGIRVILDVVLNHTGDVFAYEAPDPQWDGHPYPVAGFRDASGAPTLPFGAVGDQGWPDGAVWPAELQDPATFTRGGRIVHWDDYPEYADGDFFGLKDIHLGGGRTGGYAVSPALAALARAYQYWIAYADLDGLRVDTVKHMDRGAARFFASAIHEFAQSIGKENFYLIAEITGDRGFAYETLEAVGMDAALGLAEVQGKLEDLVKGRCDPADYFDLFRDALSLGKDSHTWFRNKVVIGYDDHDQVRKGANKARFCADGDGDRLAVAALGLNVATLGIPCVYYGSEQGFDGSGGNDRYLREAMFGGAFGPFRSRDRHAFVEEHPIYRELARILAVRRGIPALRRGRQYLRDISADGVHFGPPRMLGGRLRSLVPWSRLFADTEVLAAINTDVGAASTAWVTVDAGLHAVGDALTCRYSTDPGQEDTSVRVEARNGRAVRLTVPPAGFVVYEAVRSST